MRRWLRRSASRRSAPSFRLFNALRRTLTRTQPTAAQFPVILLFFVSGVAALIYQVCWQRLLFESLGVDIDSVTVIVSTFMLGLGLGALAGGEIAARQPQRTLELFAQFELAAALFGAISPRLIHGVCRWIAGAPLPAIVAVNFGLLLIPTVLMGATLPILVTHVMRGRENVGISVGVLYFANTLGGAFGAALTGFLALYYLGITHTIWVAAALNALVGCCVWTMLRGRDV